MLLKLTAINDSKLGKFDAKEIVGNRLDDDTEWKKMFFANNQELSAQLSEFGVGESVNVKMKQNGKFWDIVGIEKPSAEMVEKVAGSGNSRPGTPSGGNKGGGGGGWKADPNKDRGVSLRYAIDSVIATTPDADLKKMDVQTFGLKTFELMELFVDMMVGKNPFRPEEPEVPTAPTAPDAPATDPLNPPAF